MNFLTNKLFSFKWTALLVLLLILYLFVILRFNIWNYAGVSPAKPIFKDLHLVLAASECNQKGYDVYKENPCDAMGTLFAYPRLWLVLHDLGLRIEHTNIVGGFLVSTFLLVSVLIVRPRSMLEFIVFSVLIFSPSVMLGVERGNTDLFIFITLVFTGYLLANSVSILKYLAYPIFYLAAFLKLYPAASFGVFICLIKQRKNFWALVFFSIIVFGLFIWIFSHNILQVQHNIPRPSGWLSFGVASFYRSIISGNLLVVATLLTSVVVCWIGLILSRKTAINKIAVNPLNKIYFLLGSWNIMFCFFLNTNFEYRAIFYILLFPFLYDVLRSKDVSFWTRRLIYIFFGFLTISLWFNFFRYALEFTGKTFGRLDLAENLTWAFFILKQLGYWANISIIIAIHFELIKQPLQHMLWGVNVFQPFNRFRKTDQTGR